MAGARKRGFAAMNQDQQRAIASKGGRAAHRKGTAHQFSPEEARKAGYLGGKVVSANREHMATIGRKGGQRAGRAADAQRNTPPDRQGPNTDGPTMSPFKGYPQQAGESPPVVLPHWRETPAEASPAEEDEQDGERARQEQDTASMFSTFPEADLSSTTSEFPPKE